MAETLSVFLAIEEANFEECIEFMKVLTERMENINEDINDRFKRITGKVLDGV